MTTRNSALLNGLSQEQEITITVTGRKSGRPISLPVWFAWEDGQLYLLPVQGSDSQWYKNVQKNPEIRIDAAGAKAELKLATITDHEQVKSVVERFRAKYGDKNVKKYYSKLDVALVGRPK